MADIKTIPLLNHRFYVQVDGMMQAMFTSLGALTLEIEATKYAEGGNPDQDRVFIGPKHYSNLVLKRGISYSHDFLGWILGLEPGKVDRRSLTILHYDQTGAPVRRLHFKKAFPVKWINAEWSAPEGVIALETLELVHEGMTLG